MILHSSHLHALTHAFHRAHAPTHTPAQFFGHDDPDAWWSTDAKGAGEAEPEVTPEEYMKMTQPRMQAMMNRLMPSKI